MYKAQKCNLKKGVILYNTLYFYTLYFFVRYEWITQP